MPLSRRADHAQETLACRQRLIEQMLERYLAQHVPSIARRLAVYETHEVALLEAAARSAGLSSVKSDGGALRYLHMRLPFCLVVTSQIVQI